MLFLLPVVTLVLLVLFMALLAGRILRRRHFRGRASRTTRVAAALGRRSGQRAAARTVRGTGSGPRRR